MVSATTSEKEKHTEKGMRGMGEDFMNFGIPSKQSGLERGPVLREKKK